MNQDDIREIKADVKELVKQGAVHNELLRTHEARSLELQRRQEVLAESLAPIQKHVFFVDILLKSLGAVLIALAIKFLASLVF